MLVRRAELALSSENPQKYEAALETFLVALTEMNSLCTEITTVIAEHDAKGELLKQTHRAALEDHSATMGGEPKQAQREGSATPSEDPAEDDFLRSPFGAEHRHRRNALQARLREVHVVLHQIRMRLGDVYHNLGDSAKEDEAYTAAEALRSRLLKGMAWLLFVSC